MSQQEHGLTKVQARDGQRPELERRVRQKSQRSPCPVQRPHGEQHVGIGQSARLGIKNGRAPERNVVFGTQQLLKAVLEDVVVESRVDGLDLNGVKSRQ